MKKALLIAVTIVACITLFSMMAVGESRIQGGKCNFNSDCSHGICKDHKCGGCNFNSDCKGYGICNKHQCGYCNFSSDCKGFGSCSSHQCTKNPW